MSDLLYNAGKLGILNGTIDLIHDDIKVMMVTSGYVPDADHSYVDEGMVEDPAHNEISGQGYARKGISGRSIIKDVLFDKIRFYADSVIYPNLKTDTIAGIIIFKSTGNDATSPLIMWIDSGGFPCTPKEINMTIIWSEGGVFTL
ncbi:MAG: hypothetical protein AB1847_17545 [bacterium]